MPQVFVSSPFGTDPNNVTNVWTVFFDEVMDKLGEEIEPDGTLRIVRAGRELRDLALRTDVETLIDNSAVMVAVLAPNNPNSESIDPAHCFNANVMWEIGYAQALGKPVVLLVESRVMELRPELIRSMNACAYDHPLLKTNESIEQNRSKYNQIINNVTPYVRRALEQARTGLDGIHQSKARIHRLREDLHLDSLIATARERVHILTTNLDWFQFLLDPETEDTHAFETALKNGVEINILAMDPESPHANYRAVQLGFDYDVREYRNTLRESIIRLYAQFHRFDKFRLKLYDDLPLQITFQIDNKIFTNVLTTGRQARSNIHLQFNSATDGVSESFRSHFDHMIDGRISKDSKGISWITKGADRFLAQSN